MAEAVPAILHGPGRIGRVSARPNLVRWRRFEERLRGGGCQRPTGRPLRSDHRIDRAESNSPIARLGCQVGVTTLTLARENTTRSAGGGRMRRQLLALLALSAVASALCAADADYRTPESAIPAKIQPAATGSATGPAPYLGVQVRADATGRVVVDDLQPDSPAERAGVKVGDTLAKVDGKDVASADAFRAVLRAKVPGNSMKLTMMRAGKPVEATATLTALSKPMPAG